MIPTYMNKIVLQVEFS